MFSFLHSSDLHIGKRFGNLPEDLRGRLREARHGVIARLASAAREHGAMSSCSRATPSIPRRRRRPCFGKRLVEMARNAPLRWVLLPGNHDSLLADQLWSAARGVVPDNVILATGAGAPSA